MRRTSPKVGRQQKLSCLNLPEDAWNSCGMTKDRSFALYLQSAERCLSPLGCQTDMQKILDLLLIALCLSDICITKSCHLFLGFTQKSLAQLKAPSSPYSKFSILRLADVSCVLPSLSLHAYFHSVNFHVICHVASSVFQDDNVIQEELKTFPF